MMYVTIFFVKPLFILGYYFIYPQNREFPGEINVEMCIIEKTKKIHSEKAVSWFSLKP